MGYFQSHLAAMWRGFQFWRRPQPIEGADQLADFCFQRAAFIAQTTLYGYLRTRAGLQHFNLFTDAKFTALLRPARSRLILVCLDDLAIYAAAQLGAQAAASASQMRDIADYIFTQGCRQIADGGHDQELPADTLSQEQANFAARLALVDWAARHGTAAFEKSPQALIELAPIVDTLKAYDHEIVVNSMHFKWRAIRSELNQRLSARAVLGHGGW